MSNPISYGIARSTTDGGILWCNGLLREQPGLLAQFPRWAAMVEEVTEWGEAHPLDAANSLTISVSREGDELVWLVTDMQRCGSGCRELKSVREHLSMVLDVAPVGIWMQNSRGKLSFVNRAFCEAIGIQETEFLAAERYDMLLPAEYVPACLASDAKALASDGQTVTIQRLPMADGRIHDLEVYKAVRRDAAGEPVALVGVAIDATVRLADGLAINKAKESAELLSRAKSEFINLMSHELLTPIHGILDLAKLMDGEDAPGKPEFVQGILASGEKLRRITEAILAYSRLDVRSPEESRVAFNIAESVAAWFEKHCVEDAARKQPRSPCFMPVTNHGDSLVLAVQRKLEENYAQPLSVGDMAAWGSVCSRTLARRFQAATGTLPGSYFQQLRLCKAKEMLENTLKSLEEVIATVGYKDVASFRKRFREQFGALPSLHRKRHTHGERRQEISLHCDVTPELDRTVFGDELGLNRVLSTLLSNALKFTRQGGVKLTVSAAPPEQGQIEVVFTLIDTGIGIPENFMPHLFTPFMQAEDTLTRLHGGIGLNLALSKKLVGRMGGELRIESTEGQGVTARLRLRFDLG